jgi:2-phosphosulfolactate phosphatase
MQIEVCHSPAQYPLFHKPNHIVVVIDVLRATSAIVTAFYHGVTKMIPVASLEEAKRFQDLGFLAAAERHAQVVEGFDLGNSPFGYMNPKLKGKTIAITTSNGTQAITIAARAERMLMGSFLNLDALCDVVAEDGRNVIFLCAGWKNKFNLEDSLMAGAAATILQNKFTYTTVCDSTIAAMHLYRTAESDLFAFLEQSSHRKRLSKLQLERDIHYCLTLNQCPIVPELDGRYIIKA